MSSENDPFGYNIIFSPFSNIKYNNFVSTVDLQHVSHLCPMCVKGRTHIFTERGVAKGKIC